MPLICTTVMNFVEEEVLEPVHTQVSQQQQKCKNYGWPLNWLCWFVTTLVLVVIWITRTIVVPISTTVCKFVSWTLLPLAAVIDAICQKCHAMSLFFQPAIDHLGTQPSAIPGQYVYTFVCHCPKGDIKIEVTAANDEEAAQKAKEACAGNC